MTRWHSLSFLCLLSPSIAFCATNLPDPDVSPLPSPVITGQSPASSTTTKVALVAPSDTHTAPAHKNTVDVYLSGGPAFNHYQTSGSIVNPVPTLVTTYPASSNQNNGVYTAAASYTFKRIKQKPVDVSLGVAYVGATQSTVAGNSQTTLSGAGTFTSPYSYSVASQAALFEQRLTYHFKAHPAWAPYVVTGIGMGWNTLSNFNGFNGTAGILMAPAHRLGAIPNAQEPFSNETTTSLSYEAGMGLERVLTEHLALSADYRYINFGQGSLGGIPNNPTIANRLSISNIGENTVLFGLKASFAA